MSVSSDSQVKSSFPELFMMAGKIVFLKARAGPSMLKGGLELINLCKALCSPKSRLNISQET